MPAGVPSFEAVPGEHDAPMSEPVSGLLYGDATGRLTYESDPSPFIVRNVRCAECGKPLGVYYGREDTYEAAVKRGGPRCAEHPLDERHDNEASTANDAAPDRSQGYRSHDQRHADDRE